MANPISFLLILLVVPLVWSALIQAIRYIAGQPAVLHDKAEKAIMFVMLLPIAAGLSFLAAKPFTTTPEKAHTFYPPIFDGVAEAATRAIPKLAPQGPDLMGLLVPALLGIYLAGLAFAIWRVGQAHSHLKRIVSYARPAGLGPHVLCTDQPMPAFAWGRERIIIPEALLNRLSAPEVALVLAHERAHQRRGDPSYFIILSLIEAILWFNPLFAHQARICRLAAELDCDALAVGQDARMRKTYAKTLLIALKYASVPEAAPGVTLVPTFFSDKDSYKMRLSQIMIPPSRPRTAIVRMAAMCLLAAPVLMLQMAFAEGRKIPVIAAISAVVTTKAPIETDSNFPFHTAPVDSPVTSAFGMRKDPMTGKPRAHSGVDFDVAAGTPVKSPASGTIAFAYGRWIPRESPPPVPGSGFKPSQDGWWGAYGMIVEIDHGSGLKTRYAHLDKLLVKAGDHVSEGQIIALSGNTGQSTHPHLHFEVWQNDKPVNPASIMALR